MDFDTVNKRTKWAMDFIIKKEHLSNVKLAEKMDISPGTINSYRNMSTTPNIEFISKFCELFKFSLLWFVQGMGWPFADAWKTHPDSKGPTPIPPPPDIPGLFGPEADAPFIPLRERYPERYPLEQASAPGAGVDPVIQAMSDIKDIFASEDPILIPAIQANLSAFKRSLLRERQFAQLINENKELQGSIADLQTQVNSLRLQVDRLTASPTTAAQQEAG